MLVDLLAWLKDDLCVAERILNAFAVKPMYSFWLSLEFTVFLYTKSLVRHLKSLATLTLQPFSTGRCLEPSILLLWPEILYLNILRP